MAKINENTGKLTLSGSENEFVVLPANADVPMRIEIQKKSDHSVLYSQSVALGSAGKIEPVSSLAEALAKAK